MEGKKILITGAGSGLGKALSLWLSKLRADLYLLSQSKQKLEDLQAELKSPTKIYAIDFTDETALDQVLLQLLETNFIPDVIIHCAGGGFKMHDPLLARQEFCKLVDINLLSGVQINNKLIPKMVDRQSGVIIHVGSTADSAAHGSVAYNTAKAALAAYVRSLGKALAASGVVVTGISPGSFIAEGNNMFRFKNDKPVEFENYVAALPSKRMIDVAEFFSIVEALCNQKTPLLSGCMVPLDAGEGMGYTA
ncbi:SDR family oxidoreductase [Coxiella burnetii]|uniref:SDR family NAD(P)-dependent oxidoreductase n=1 Tax=Coxiella burnetii TaxID=777 RepID=UPI002175A164|nr:SDR family oxidoreductase [Coxiella burnetii]